MRATVAAISLLVTLPPAIAQESQYGNCIREAISADKFRPLESKMVLTSGKQPFEILAINTKPTPTEKPLISAWAQIREDCFNQDESERRKLPAPGQAAVEKLHRDVLSAAAELYNGTLTYGQFAKARTELGSQFDATWAALREQSQRDRQAMQAQDQQRRQAAAAYLLNRPQPQPYQVPTYQIPAPQQPAQTNCTTYGNQTNCTTR
jgi:hypothetical protein